MSADNWAVCPWCELRLNDSLRKAKAELNAKYGKVPAESFIAERDALKKIEATALDPTLREDYEIGVSVSGFFTVDYGASCNEPRCGFTFRFKQKDTIPAPPSTHQL